MAKADMNIKILTISEDELRKIIREEVRRAVEPGAIRPPYLPPTGTPQRPLEWWQNPVMCGTAVAQPLEGTVVVNA